GQYVDPADTTNTNADAIANIPIVTSRGVVPLGSLTSIGAERSATEISHEDGSRLGTVNAYVKDGQNAVETSNQIEKTITATKLPDGVRVTYGGDTEDINKTFTEMIAALVAGVALMFAILVLEFNAFRTSGRLLLAIPLSLTGVLIGLWITSQPVSITAMLGIIALGGVLINHGILLLDVMNNLRHKMVNAEPLDIVLDAATTRIRPILLTTVTTVIGMIPLIFVSGMWAPLAYTVSFGLLYGTLLTLVLIPLLSYRYEVKHRKVASK
ncbi:MAG TPA: efflux RND transporter permease subunit, partial [Candidatus Paceibacterota bacterium]